MRKLTRTDIVDYQTWTDQRPTTRPAILITKAIRRFHVGENLTFLFENRDTIRYQIQEMLRIEQIVREREIAHEITTYNELIGDDGGFGCTLLIEIDSEAERNVKLREWLGLTGHLYVRFEDDSQAYATFDPRQVGDDRLSSVQYLKFNCDGRVPTAIGCDHAACTYETALNSEQRAALAQDLTE